MTEIREGNEAFLDYQAARAAAGREDNAWAGAFLGTMAQEMPQTLGNNAQILVIAMDPDESSVQFALGTNIPGLSTQPALANAVARIVASQLLQTLEDAANGDVYAELRKSIEHRRDHEE